VVVLLDDVGFGAPGTFGGAEVLRLNGYGTAILARRT